MRERDEEIYKYKGEEMNRESERDRKRERQR